MADYNYIYVDLDLFTIVEREELIEQAVEDSIDTCKWSEDGQYIILKYRGDPPPAFVKHRANLPISQKAKDFNRDVVDDPSKKFSHEKQKKDIVLKEKKTKP